jgi:hypothetical protein
MKSIFRTTLIVAALAIGIASPAAAIPHLQLYIEGATYDAGLESWVVEAGTFNLWVIGNVGADGTIFDVKLATSMYGTAGSISITPTTASGITDPSTPQALVDIGSNEAQFQSGGIYETPAFTPVSHHAEYADADAHNFWQMGDFDKTDSPVGDFIDGYPVNFPSTGQINAYSVSVTGWTAVHFDAFDHTVMSTGNGDKYKYWFVPPSHDATAVPEPGTIALLGLGLAGVAARVRRKRQS